MHTKHTLTFFLLCCYDVQEVYSTSEVRKLLAGLRDELRKYVDKVSKHGIQPGQPMHCCGMIGPAGKNQHHCCMSLQLVIDS